MEGTWGGRHGTLEIRGSLVDEIVAGGARADSDFDCPWGPTVARIYDGCLDTVENIRWDKYQVTCNYRFQGLYAQHQTRGARCCLSRGDDDWPTKPSTYHHLG